MQMGIIYEQKDGEMKQKAEKPIAITPRYDDILRAVHECRYATVNHITRLFYAPSSYSHVNEIMTMLAGGRDHATGYYLYRFPLPNTRIGNTERVYTLGGKGIKYLEEEDGCEVAWRFDAAKLHSLSYGYLMHQLDITSFLIGAKLYSQENDRNGIDPHLEEYKTEYILRPLREKVTITVKSATGATGEQSVEVVPDLWLDFHFTHPKQPHAPVLVEIDRGSEGLKKFKEKIKALLAFISGPGYKNMFGVRPVTIAYVVTAGPDNRLETILKWTHEVLTEQHMTNFADTFRFCRLYPHWETEYTRLFTAPHWYRPADKRSLPLLS